MTLLDTREHFQPFAYPQAFEFLKSQEKVFWNAHEINTERDIQQYHNEFTEADKHLIQTLLKVFTTYEMKIGCFWSDVVASLFAGHWEVAAMAKMFSAMENVHAVFYNKLNEGLYMNTPSFYTEFTREPQLNSNVKILDDYLNHPDIATKLAAFSFAEGVKLYGSFAVLLNFPRHGKLRGVENGLKYSVFDEALHCRASSWLYKTYCDEVGYKLSAAYLSDMANEFVEVELQLVDVLFSVGEIEGITKQDVVDFVHHRANRVLTYLGTEGTLPDNRSSVASWFYPFINAQEDTDFFVSKVTEYEQGWDFSGVTKW